MLNCLCEILFNNSVSTAIFNIIIIIWFISLIMTIFEKYNAHNNNYLIITFFTMFVLYKLSISHIIKRFNNCIKK